MKRIFLLCFISSTLIAQPQLVEKPKLVVGIVVDQMRQEYLYRYSPKFGQGGFKRLVQDGFMLRNAHYNYVPTYTGPGHASIYTGATPATHGIIGNEWYDKIAKDTVNCIEDKQFTGVGASAGGAASPNRLQTSTITDELRISTQKRGKVISMSHKDRGAILPGGHQPDGAYWYSNQTGGFMSSTYYKPGLPFWVEKFNQLNLADKYLSGIWNTVFPIDQYKESGMDDSPYEGTLKGKEKPIFPYNLAELRKTNGNFALLTNTPFADDLLTEFAKMSIAEEQLGADEWPDFLAISYSTPDLIGHAMGPNSIEVEDTYVRLDKNIEDLLNTLDKKVGAGQYTVFLTSDHGVADVIRHMQDMKIPAKAFDGSKMRSGLANYLNGYFPGAKLIENISNQQIFLDQSLFQGNPKTSGVDYLVVTQLIVRYLQSVEGISEVWTEEQLGSISKDDTKMAGRIARGFHPARSGDVVFTLLPGWFTSSATGTTHGSGYAYDTHVPILFYGNGIKKGYSDVYHPIVDIAPTIATLLKIKFPNGCDGQSVAEALK